MEIRGTIQVKNIAVSFSFLLEIERITASLYRNMDATAATQVTFVWLKAIPRHFVCELFQEIFSLNVRRRIKNPLCGVNARSKKRNLHTCLYRDRAKTYVFPFSIGLIYIF